MKQSESARAAESDRAQCDTIHRQFRTVDLSVKSLIVIATVVLATTAWLAWE